MKLSITRIWGRKNMILRIIQKVSYCAFSTRERKLENLTMADICGQL